AVDLLGATTSLRGCVPDQERGDRRSRSLDFMSRVTCKVQDLGDVHVELDVELVTQQIGPILQGHRVSLSVSVAAWPVIALRRPRYHSPASQHPTTQPRRSSKARPTPACSGSVRRPERLAPP